MTPILQTLIPLVTSYGTHKAVQFLEGAEELAFADDDLTSFLARRDVEWDRLETADQDSLRDAYLEAIKRECARRLTPSDPVPSPLPVSVVESKDPGSLFSRMEAALRASAKELDHFHRTGQPTKSFMASKTLILGLGDLIAELNRMPVEVVTVPSPASSPVPSPLVPEVVKTAPAGSVCEVEPLGEVTFEVISGVKGHCLSVNDRRVAGPKPWGGGRVLKTWKVPVKHLLDAVGIPSSPPSSEDTELLDWLEDDPEYWSLSRTWKDGRIIRLETGTTRYFEAVREAVRAAKASTTTQKGGQES